MAETQERVLAIKIDFAKGIKALADYQQKIDEISSKEKELKKALKDGEISMQEYNEEIQAGKQAKREYAEAMRDIQKEMQNEVRQQKEQEGSLKSLRAQLSNLTAQYDSLSEAQRKGAEGTALRDQINEITERLKGAEEETQRFYRNVGNYQNSLAPLFDNVSKKIEEQQKVVEELTATYGEGSKEVKAATQQLNALTLQQDALTKATASVNTTLGNFIGTLNPIAGNIATMATSVGNLSNMFTVAKTAVVAFSRQLLALLANPIVAILAGIAAVLMLISKGITSSEENTNRMKAILAPFTRALNFAVSILQQMAGVILTVVETGMKFYGWLGKMAERLPIVGGLIKQVNDANREAIELAKEQANIEKQERENMVSNAKDQLAVAELRQKAKDKEKFTAQDRLKFIQEANKLEEQQSKRNVELAERKLKALQIEASWADNDAETNRKLAEAEASVYNARKEYFQKTMKLKEQENTARNEIKAEAKAEADARIAAAKEAYERTKEIREKEITEVRKAQELLIGLISDSTEKQRATIEMQYNNQIEDLRKRLKEEENLSKKARQAINQQITLLEQQKQAELDKLAVEAINKEADNRAKVIAARLEAVKKGTEEERNLRLQQLAEQRDAELRDTEMTEELRLAIIDKYKAKEAEVNANYDKAIRDKQAEDMRVRFETQIAEAYGNELEISRIRIEQKQAELDQMKQMQDESDEAFRLRQLNKANEIIEEEKNLAKAQIEIQKDKLQAMGQIANGLSSLFEAVGEDNKAAVALSKTLALAEIAINTGAAISKMLSAESWKGILGIGTGLSGVATIISNMAAAIKLVNSAKFSTGGYVTGPGSGTSDSIPARLSNGESVLTARATEMFSPLLSTLNMAGGGVPINVSQSSNQIIGEEMLARAVAKGVMSMPAPVVSVQEIDRVRTRVEVLDNISKL